MLHLGVKLGLLCWRTSRGRSYSRKGWWGRYFDPIRRKWQEAEKIRLIRNFVTFVPHSVSLVFMNSRMMSGD